MREGLVWGASGGIGSALTKHLTGQGWRVFAASRREDHSAHDVDDTLHFDAADTYSFQRVAMQVGQRSEGLDLVVYAAGGLTAEPLDKLTFEAWTATLNANLTGAFLAAQASLPLLRPDGHLMFLGAYVPKVTLPRMGAYVAAKAGLESLVGVLQKENRRMRISLIRLPAVDTPFWAQVPFRLPANAMQPAQVAEALLAHFEAHGGDLDLS